MKHSPLAPLPQLPFKTALKFTPTVARSLSKLSPDRERARLRLIADFAMVTIGDVA